MSAVSSHFSVSSDSSFVNRYGSDGKLAANRMAGTLFFSGRALRLSKYDPTSETFTVLGSAHLSKTELQRIFDQTVYCGLKPEVLEPNLGFASRILTLIIGPYIDYPVKLVVNRAREG